MLLACLMIKLDSRGPIVIKQRRLDFSGQVFAAYRFRSTALSGDEPTIGHARRDGPRVTRVGHMLRQSGIDVLPQLFNVIKGEMSLVGPQPNDTAHTDDYRRPVSDRAFRRHVKPGITGWAQINGQRGESLFIWDMEDHIALDLWYIDNWSMALDFKIMWRSCFETRGHVY